MTQTSDAIREIDHLAACTIIDIENGSYTLAQQKLLRIAELRDELF